MKLSKAFRELKKDIIHNLYNMFETQEEREKPFLLRGYKSYSVQQLIDEIKVNSEVGISQLNSMIMLTCDLIKRDKSSSSNIILTRAQEKKFKNWQKQYYPLENIGTTGGHFGLKVIFTGIGEVITGFNWKGDEIDLTDYTTW